MTAEESAVGAARAFLVAFNAQDPIALAAALNYPHVRLAAGRFRTIESAEALVKLSRAGRAALAAEGWHHTVLVALDVVQSGADKVHLTLRIDRCHEDDTVYNRFDTLWIATLKDGHWGIAFRSSYLR